MAGMNDEGRQWYVVCTYNGHENKVKENLEKHNQQVITTRQDDKYYSLDYRSKKANEKQCA